MTALELWPEEGIPEAPGTWLMTAAKRRAIDSLRRGSHARAEAQRNRPRT